MNQTLVIKLSEPVPYDLNNKFPNIIVIYSQFLRIKHIAFMCKFCLHNIFPTLKLEYKMFGCA